MRDKAASKIKTGKRRPWLRRRGLRALAAALVFLAALELALQAAHVVMRARTARSEISDPGAPVILCLGDSHTYGVGVAVAESYPARLQALLRSRGYRVNVVNLGAPGMNTSEIRRALAADLRLYQPAAVIVLASVNNGWNREDAAWSDAQDGMPTPLLSRALDFFESRMRIVRGMAVLLHRLAWTRPQEETAHDRSGHLILHHRQESRRLESAKASYDRARRDLLAIIAASRAAHAIPLLMTYATDPQYDFAMSNHLLRQVAASMKVALADNDRALAPFFMRADGSMDRAARDRLFFADMHPRAAGYEKIAANVARTLKRAGVLGLLPARR